MKMEKSTINGVYGEEICFTLENGYKISFCKGSLSKKELNEVIQEHMMELGLK